ncbi:MAG TPA: aminotransferase class IV [Lacipirellulaceae bacterium]|jgi:branched-subunit amino acid aminotransferase/4-amino-4-deoxychorismate lyase|nr:aminotransferase class IV [Lacipirellulaceae bacterium]
MQTSLAYLSGEWISNTDLRLAVDDIGFMLGAAVTERLRTFRGKVFRLDEHIARLKGSLDIIGAASEKIAAEIAQVIPEFVRRNQALIDPDDDWAIAAFVTPGVAGSGKPTVCVYGYPLPFQQWATMFDTGVPVVISQHHQVPTNCWPAELKCRSRMHYYLADLEAAKRRPGARAIVLDQDGYVAESTTANVVAFREGKGLVSPPLDHILFGVSLGVVKELADELGIPFTMRQLSVDEFLAADEALLASTSICVLPIVECEGKPIGTGRPGPIFQRLLTAWGKLVGLDIADQARRFANRSA